MIGLYNWLICDECHNPAYLYWLLKHQLQFNKLIVFKILSFYKSECYKFYRGRLLTGYINHKNFSACYISNCDVDKFKRISSRLKICKRNAKKMKRAYRERKLILESNPIIESCMFAFSSVIFNQIEDDRLIFFVENKSIKMSDNIYNVLEWREQIYSYFLINGWTEELIMKIIKKTGYKTHKIRGVKHTFEILDINRTDVYVHHAIPIYSYMKLIDPTAASAFALFIDTEWDKHSLMTSRMKNIIKIFRDEYNRDEIYS